MCGLFFLSGAAALVFQTLWFRLAGLSLGNSVWAGSVVLSSFMAGLALGNALAARRREQGRSALVLYSRLELVIGVTGGALVLLLPSLPLASATLFRPALDQPWLLNALRLGVAFLLLLAPSVAMGATLPLLVSAVAGPSQDFGRALGRLYGWNTLGAVAGALLGESLLFAHLGLRGSGLFAAALNGTAALGATALARSWRPQPPASEASPRSSAARLPWGRLGVAGLCGAILLSLEVVWFRFLQLFVVGTSLTFAVMLAVVLLGIGLGGLAAGALLARRPYAHRWFPALSLGAGCLTVVGYVRFDTVFDLVSRDLLIHSPLVTLWLGLWLMLPTCFVSGMLFTLLGRALKADLEIDTLTTGALTLANTTGAALGALGAGFVLLPVLGVEKSVFLLALGYGVVAVGEGGRAAFAWPVSGERRFTVAAGAALAVLLALFPFGLMARVHVARVVRLYAQQGYQPLAFREGLTESILYLRKDVLGEPLSYRLVTNGFSMSGTDFVGRRYMKLYVHWPLTQRPDIRSALLISYGCGSTAKALTDSPGLTSIDVVDISREILELGSLVFPGKETPPLADPRVKVHVEDGRFFLLTTPKRFDLITAEPPPPRNSGIVNLYSREFFTLARERLSERGILTYWLPVFDLDQPSMRAIVRGFCDAFPDCSLWTGSGLNWMLVGSRGRAEPVSEETFTGPWRDDRIAPALAQSGFEGPGALGATYLADAPVLNALTAGTPPLVDDFPLRLSRRGAEEADYRSYLQFMDATAARERFETSEAMRAAWPPAIREAVRSAFQEQGIFNESRTGTHGLVKRDPFPLLHRALVETSSTVLPLIVMGQEPRELDIATRAAAGGVAGPLVDYLHGLGALSRREYAPADAAFARVAAAEPQFHDLARFRALARCLAGDAAGAAPFLAEALRLPSSDDQALRFWARLAETCRSPAGASGT